MRSQWSCCTNGKEKVGALAQSSGWSRGLGFRVQGPTRPVSEKGSTGIRIKGLGLKAFHGKSLRAFYSGFRVLLGLGFRVTVSCGGFRASL